MKDLFEGTAMFFAWVALCLAGCAGIGFLVWLIFTVANRLIKEEKFEKHCTCGEVSNYSCPVHGDKLIPGNHNW